MALGCSEDGGCMKLASSSKMLSFPKESAASADKVLTYDASTNTLVWDGITAVNTTLCLGNECVNEQDIKQLKALIQKGDRDMKVVMVDSLSWGCWFTIVLVVAVAVWVLPKVGLHHVVWPVKAGGRWLLAKMKAWIDRVVEEWRRIQ